MSYLHILFSSKDLLILFESTDLLLWSGTCGIWGIQCERRDDGVFDAAFQHWLRGTDTVVEFVLSLLARI